MPNTYRIHAKYANRWSPNSIKLVVMNNASFWWMDWTRGNNLLLESLVITRRSSEVPVVGEDSTFDLNRSNKQALLPSCQHTRTTPTIDNHYKNLLINNLVLLDDLMNNNFVFCFFWMHDWIEWNFQYKLYSKTLGVRLGTQCTYQPCLRTQP